MKLYQTSFCKNKALIRKKIVRIHSLEILSRGVNTRVVHIFFNLSCLKFLKKEKLFQWDTKWCQTEPRYFIVMRPCVLAKKSQWSSNQRFTTVGNSSVNKAYKTRLCNIRLKLREWFLQTKIFGLETKPKMNNVHRLNASLL